MGIHLKKLHWFILKSYIGPLFMTFLIVMFILLMQFLWKYIDELVGKGLSVDIIMELLVYASAGLVPLAIPLSTLLASLMTLGNLGENNELLAMKSAGISLPRIMQPLLFMTALITVGGFVFSNTVVPYSNLKISTLLWDVRQQRPELQIKVGVFNNDIDDYRIKIASKDPRTNLMRNIIIYDHRSKEGNLVVTVADSGYMNVTNDEKYMVVNLYNGYTYQEMLENRSVRRSNQQKFPARRNKFEEQVILLELKGFEMQRSNEDLFRKSYLSLNLGQLSSVSDSLGREIEERVKSLINNIFTSTIIKSPWAYNRDSTANVTHFLRVDSVYSKLPLDVKHSTVSRALSSARAAKNYISSIDSELYNRGKFRARHQIEWHRKYALSFACLVFFFIGAPLGAIIRKGGLGMPVVVSILFFVFYYIIALTGEKFVRELVWNPNLGMWVSSIILLPLGVFLSYKATTDSVIMNADFYILAVKRFLSFKRGAKAFYLNWRRRKSF